MADYHECLEEIEALRSRGINRGLERMEKACRVLGNPQDRFPSVHIAGTNGKGSCSAMTAEILRCAHYKTGLTLSPHIENFRERMQINGQWISKDDFVHVHTHLKKKTGQIPLTYFEWGILMAFYYFAASRVDMAVLETGIGGRWDATNMAKPLVGVITNVSLDHETILGARVEEILEEKMQILKPGMMAWTALEEPELYSLLTRYCQQKGISLYRLADYFRDQPGEGFSVFDYRGLRSSLAGVHQKKNAALAVAIAKSLDEKGYRISRSAIEEGLLKVHWPCRLETVASNPNVLLDGAHNRAAVKALGAFLAAQSKSYHLVYGTLKDRPFEEMLKILLPHAQSVTFALFEEERAYSEGELTALLKKTGLGDQHGFQILSIKQEAWAAFCQSIPAGESILVTGSLYLAAQVRSLIKNRL